MEGMSRWTDWGLFFSCSRPASALIFVITLARCVRIVPQQRMDVVERLGKYQPHAQRPG